MGTAKANKASRLQIGMIGGTVTVKCCLGGMLQEDFTNGRMYCSVCDTGYSLKQVGRAIRKAQEDLYQLDCTLEEEHAMRHNGHTHLVLATA